eukprot:893141-Pelagomonas_calceolata.AAC.8
MTLWACVIDPQRTTQVTHFLYCPMGLFIQPYGALWGCLSYGAFYTALRSFQDGTRYSHRSRILPFLSGPEARSALPQGKQSQKGSSL